MGIRYIYKLSFLAYCELDRQNIGFIEIHRRFLYFDGKNHAKLIFEK